MVRIIRSFGINEFECFGAKNFKLCQISRISDWFIFFDFRVQVTCSLSDAWLWKSRIASIELVKYYVIQFIIVC